MIFDHTDYRTYLRSVLSERVSKNPVYSLRAFAKNLDIPPSTLSDILRGRRRFSLKSAYDTARRLGLKPRQVEYFLLLVRLDGTQDTEERSNLLEQLRRLNSQKPVRDLSVDHFRVISDWYHLAILEMTYLGDGKLNPQKIASELGISKIEAEAAIERLERLELLTQDRKGRYSKTADRWIAKSVAPEESFKKFHRQMLNKAIVAVDTQRNDEKFVGSEVFPFDQRQLERVKEILEEAFNKVIAISREGGDRQSVYHLGIQLFNLTHKRKAKS